MRAPRAASVSTQERAISGVFAAGILGLFVVAATLNASPDGYGTHTQLGLSDCGFASAFGRPCATCGMTTAFAHAADFSLLQSAITQPAGAVFAVSASIAFWILLYIASTGSPVGRTLMHTLGRKVLWGGLILLGAAWAYKVSTWTPGL